MPVLYLKVNELIMEKFLNQINKIRNIIKNFKEPDINGFKKILYEMIEDVNKKKFDEINN